MRNKVLNEIKKRGLVRRSDRVLCALSGGADSCAMTHILAGLRQELGIEVSAAHFSHGLRLDAAEHEKELCERLCEKLGVPFFSERGDTKAYAAAERIGIEQAARELRYNFLRSVAQQWGAQKIATAHNMSDSAETVLFNLIRGSGAWGLRGIPRCREEFIRPLLDISRSEIEFYNRQNNIIWAEDETNAQNDCARNKIRNVILPQLREINSAAVENIVSAAALISRDERWLSRQANEIFLKCERCEDGGVSISCDLLAAAHPALSSRAIIMLCAETGVSLGGRQVQAVLDICMGGSPSAETALGGGAFAMREYDILRIGRKHKSQPPQECLLEYDKPCKFGEWEITLHRGYISGEYDFLAYIDRSCGPITVRTRRTGDTILTSGGTKTIKKFMIEQKILQKNRDRIPIICDNNRVSVILYKKERQKNDLDMAAVTARRFKGEE